jgi:hypothetical protein
MAQSPVKALRLYGVAASEIRGATSLAEGTSLVHFRQLAAVVEEGDYTKIEITAEELQKYQLVVEEVYSHTPILPAPPGTVFKSQETLVRWLELHYFSLVEALGQVEGHTAARLTLSVGEAVKNTEATKKFQTLASDALRSFRKSSAATVTHPPLDGEDGIIVKASFLVETERWQEFADAVAAEAKRHREFDFNLTGPWPPYDFVQMQFGG